MTVLIMHPNDEIFFADFQKELIEKLFENGRTIYSQVPLWIELGDFEIKEKAQMKIIIMKFFPRYLFRSHMQFQFTKHKDLSIPA